MIEIEWHSEPCGVGWQWMIKRKNETIPSRVYVYETTMPDLPEFFGYYYDEISPIRRQGAKWLYYFHPDTMPDLPAGVIDDDHTASDG
jgi:hypothetical protein